MAGQSSLNLFYGREAPLVVVAVAILVTYMAHLIVISFLFRLRAKITSIGDSVVVFISRRRRMCGHNRFKIE